MSREATSPVQELNGYAAEADGSTGEGVGAIPDGPAQAPGRQVAAERLDHLESRHGDLQGDANHAQYDRAEDVAQTTKQGDPGGLDS